MCFVCLSQHYDQGTGSGHIALANGGAGGGVIRQASFTGNEYYIDALLNGLSWTGQTDLGATITYNFNYSAEGGEPFGVAERALALDAMQQWAKVANIDFQATTGISDITFSQEDLGPGLAGLATTFFNGSQITSSEAQIDDDITQLAPNSFGYLTILHEIGHTLGLKHPGQYSESDVPPFLPEAEDNIQNSVMSYNNGPLVNQQTNAPITPMIYDIAAMQKLYGANTDYMAGDTSWDFNGTRQTMTIWDGGGDDTVSAAGYSFGDALIDLRAGFEHVSQIGQAVVLMAFGADIEHAIGSNQNDTLVGNSLSNELFGSNGRDSLRGGEANDTLYGGDAIADADDDNDTMAGENGSDIMYGNTGDDLMFGGGNFADLETGSDTIYGGFGADSIYGNAGDDSLFGGGALADPNDLGDTIAGGKGADYIIGNGGDDFIYGGGAAADPEDLNDTIFAGFGNDTVLGNGGDDFIDGGPGNDELNAGLGDDTHFFGNGSGQDIITFFEGAGAVGGDIIQLVSDLNGSGIMSAADAAAAATFTGDTATLDLGGGNSLTVLGLSTALSADDFSIF